MEKPFKNVTGPNPAAKNKASSWTLGEKANPAVAFCFSSLSKDCEHN